MATQIRRPGPLNVRGTPQVPIPHNEKGREVPRGSRRRAKVMVVNNT